MDILGRLQDIFRDFFDDETIVLQNETSPDDIEEWDSLAQVNILVICEVEFDIRFDVDEIESIKNAGDIIDLIERKLNQ